MPRKTLLRLATIGFFLVGFQSACLSLFAQAGAKAAAPKQTSANTPAASSAALDRQVEAQIHERLAKSKIGQDKITARVENGIIYLDGTTTISQHKGAATRMAKSIMNKNPGVKKVVNNIKVSKLGSSPVNHATVSKPSKSFSEAPAWTPAKTAPASTPAAAPAVVAKETPHPAAPTTQAQAKSPVSGDPQSGPRKVAVQWK